MENLIEKGEVHGYVYMLRKVKDVSNLVLKL